MKKTATKTTVGATYMSPNSWRDRLRDSLRCGGAPGEAGLLSDAVAMTATFLRQ